MPTFDYKCENCGTFEIFQKISDPVLEICPDCGAIVERKISGGAGIIMGGSSRSGGRTCCGREERCETPPCSAGECCPTE
ncbi:zinc ribbon domain-containing protein [candidate division KSB1 bacterium]|nr:zinc ribbon domain-containing protein [candidate division KSB1 bacterium]